MPPDLSWLDGGAPVAEVPTVAPAAQAPPATPTADLSWLDGDTPASPATPAPTPTIQPVVGIDAASTAGQSYATLIASKEFVSASYADRAKLFDQWERKDALARASALGLNLADTKTALAQRRREFAASYADQNVLDGAYDILQSTMSGFAGLVKNI